MDYNDLAIRLAKNERGRQMLVDSARVAETPVSGLTHTNRIEIEILAHLATATSLLLTVFRGDREAMDTGVLHREIDCLAACPTQVLLRDGTGAYHVKPDGRVN